MTVRLYRSSDASAPQIDGSASRVLEVLNACLVTGYGAKAAAGWTKPYSDTDNAVFRQAAGYSRYVKVSQTGPLSVEMRGYETMSGLSTGTGDFPTVAQQSGGMQVACKDDGFWTLVADERFFILNHGGVLIMFGDILSTNPMSTNNSVIFNLTSNDGYSNGSGTSTQIYVKPALYGTGSAPQTVCQQLSHLFFKDSQNRIVGSVPWVCKTNTSADMFGLESNANSDGRRFVSLFESNVAYIVESSDTWYTGRQNNIYVKAMVERILSLRPYRMFDFGDARKVSTSYTPISHLHFDGVDNGTTFTDVAGKTWTVVNAKTKTDRFVFGRASGYFSGGNSKITSNTSADFAFGSGNFTMDFRIRREVSQPAIPRVMGNLAGPWVANKWTLGYDSGVLTFYVNNGSISISSGTLSANVWYHVTIQRDGNVLQMFVDGVEVARTAMTVSLDGGSSEFFVLGSSGGGVTEYFNGNIDELMLVKGHAIRSGNFTPPSSPYADGAKTFLRNAQVAYDSAEGTNTTTMNNVESMLSRNGVVGSRFNGYTSNSQMPSIPANKFSTNGYAALALVYPSTILGTYDRIVNVASSNTSDVHSIALMRNNNTQDAGIAFAGAGGTFTTCFSSTSAYKTGKWNLLGGSMSTAGELRAYIDGDKKNTVSSSAISTVAMPYCTFMSLNRTTPSIAGEGTIAVSAIFDRNISDAEHLAIYESMVTGKLPSELLFRSDDDTLSAMTGKRLVCDQVSVQSSDGSPKSILFAGNSNQRFYSDVSGLGIGSGDFCVEAMVYPTTFTSGTTKATIFTNETSATGSEGATAFELYYGNDGIPKVFHNNAVALTSSSALTLDTWQKVILRRVSGAWSMRIDGTQVASGYSNSSDLSSSMISFGGNPSETSAWFKGNMRKMRVWKGLSPY